MPRRILKGVVISGKSNKTVVVKVERKFMHPTFKKYITRSKKYSVHDEKNSSKVGEVIRIVECKPRSKTKSWELFKAANTSSSPKDIPEESKQESKK